MKVLEQGFAKPNTQISSLIRDAAREEIAEALGVATAVNAAHDKISKVSL
jgi:hypothetical protein